MPKLFTVIDARAGGAEQTIAAEAHVIGEDTANWVFLNEMALESTGVTIAGKTEVTGVPADDEFRVYYEGLLAGAVEFNAADNGESITIAYDGRGSPIFARDPNRVMQKVQGVKTLVDGANIAWSLKDQHVFYVELAGDRTLDNPTDMEDGITVLLMVAQDGTGTRLLSYGTAFDFGSGGAPVLSTDPDVFDVLGFVVLNSTMVFMGIQKGFAV